MEDEAVKEFKEGAGPWSLWVGVLVPPLAMLIQLQVNYSLVYWACGTTHVWGLHLVSLLTLLVTVACGLLALRNWRLAGGETDDKGAGVIPRSRFMALVGIMESALITLVIIAQWVPIFVYGACQR